MAFTNPRRTTKTTSSAMTPSSSTPAVKTNMSLRKGATFHTPPASPEPHFKTPSLPRRSQTNLEDVVEAHQRRVALTLGDVDRVLDSLDATTSRSFRDEASPVPSGFLNHTVNTRQPEAMAPPSADVANLNVSGRTLRPRRQIRRPSNYDPSESQPSVRDSGYGSRSEKRSVSTGLTSMCEAVSKTTVSGITRSAAVHPSTLESLPRMSERATNRIHEFIIRPILAKSSLKDFHPVVRTIPQQIQKKEIVCLRDLEKTLIFRAPERAKTAKLYLEFCLTSIRCIQATVEFLNEREQTRPSDRPYTNGYFVDLVDQIRSYAQQVQANKEKEANGEKLDELDAESSDEVKLYGGLTRNGRPAELVRVKKNGKAISIATGEPVKMESIEEDEKGAVVMKRSMSQELADDDAILRSMARRKRSASAAELAPKRCREPNCTKEFKRSCDLTKHEKTHSRPWKCSTDGCKYQEYGWPTEKELDRHTNDKHSSSPVLYKCHYAPCPYKSKRESNCKQHMEKSHGWTYVRSKNNGKNRSKNGDSSLPTPQTFNHRTPESENVLTPDEEDYEMPEARNGSVGFDNSVYNDFADVPEYHNDPNDFNFNDLSHEMPFISPVDSNQHHPSLSSSAGTSPFMVTNSNAFQMNDIEANFGTNFGTNFVPGNDFTLFEQEDIYNANARIRVPVNVPDIIFQQHYAMNTTMPIKTDNIPHISPGGRGNTMLFTPTSMNNLEDSFEYDPTDMDNGVGQDFQLFSHASTNAVNFGRGPSQFEVPSAVGGFSQPTSQEFFQAFYNAQTSIGINNDWLVNNDESYAPYSEHR